MWSIDVIRYENSVLHYFQARIYHVYTSLYALCGDVDSLFEYMRNFGYSGIKSYHHPT